MATAVLNGNVLDFIRCPQQLRNEISHPGAELAALTCAPRVEQVEGCRC